MGGTHRTYFDLPTCQANCGKGKWQCMLNAQNAGCAEDHAVMCVPDLAGKCADLASCEPACGHGGDSSFANSSRMSRTPAGAEDLRPHAG